MTAGSSRTLVRLRIAAQASFLALFLLLFLRAGDAQAPSWASRGLFFALDPLLLLLQLLSTHTVLAFALLSLVPLALTLLLGRFFCGWVCPLGSLHQLAGRAMRRRAEAVAPDRRLLRLKYLVLAGAVVAAALGSQLGSLLDPIAFSTRSLASAVNPAVENTLSPETLPRAAIQPVLIGTLFLLLLAANAWRRRFFCVALCPLGALYGLVARFSLLDLRAENGCGSCGGCANGCPVGSGPVGDRPRSECLLCFSCAAGCPQDAIEARLAVPNRLLKTPPRSVVQRRAGASEGASVDLGRRRLLGAATVGLAVAVLPNASLAARQRSPRSFLRPPGALGEADFLDRCVRCGQCVEACPTSFIQPALLEAGLEGLWTPVLDPRAGACTWECRQCTVVCPSGAIAPLTLEQKQRFKVGTAVVDRSRCYTWADGFNCTACADRCPVPEKAIRFREAQVVDYRGKRVTVRQAYVDPEPCTGCGICEHVCPRRHAPGIFVIPEDEAREAPGA